MINPTFKNVKVSKINQKIGELKNQLKMSEELPLKRMAGSETVLGCLHTVN